MTREQLLAMAIAARQSAKPDAAQKVAQICIDLSREPGESSDET